MFNTIIQILLAIFVILILGFIAYSVYDRDYIASIRLFNTNKKETKIFTGVYPYCDNNVIRLETMNRDDPYYIDINPSVNQNGGAEYSYNFWLYFNITSTNRRIVPQYSNDSGIRDSTTPNEYIILFYKGVKQLITYKQNDYSCDTTANANPIKYLLVKNPLVKINNDGSELVVEYNNISTPDSYNNSAVKLTCGNITNGVKELNKNKLGIKNIDTELYNKTYNMITIVMQETPSNEDALFSNRTNCKVYFNGTLIADRSTYNNNIMDDTNVTDIISTAMKKNLGSLYINPASNLTDITAVENANGPRYISKINKTTATTNMPNPDCSLKMADLSYFNYALSDGEIKLLYKRGFDTTISDISTREMGLDKKNFIKGNKIDFNMYNNAAEGAMPVNPI